MSRRKVGRAGGRGDGRAASWSVWKNRKSGRAVPGDLAEVGRVRQGPSGQPVRARRLASALAMSIIPNV